VLSLPEILRQHEGKTLEFKPIPELNSEAIDFRVASECFKQVRKLTRQSLHSRQVTTTYHRREVPTVGASNKDPHNGYHVEEGV
jgi:ATP-dependent DNA helicase RecG